MISTYSATLKYSQRLLPGNMFSNLGELSGYVFQKSKYATFTTIQVVKHASLYRYYVMQSIKLMIARAKYETLQILKT